MYKKDENELLLRTILGNSIIEEILPAIAQINLPDWWLAGGAVRNTVWRAIFGEECKLVINDFDIAFFDLQGDREQELTAKNKLNQQFPDCKFDVKNQASFHRWRHGRQIYHSAEHGIENWLHTATAVGVKLDQQGEWQFFTPYGLDDLFNGIVRTKPSYSQNSDPERKAASFLEKCPHLQKI